jgi:sulfofructose kinase
MSPAFDLLGIGLNATDTLLLVQEFPAYAGKVAFDRELLSPGGQVATAVVACARLGLRTRYIGTIGDDLRGDIQRDSLEGTGVDTTGLIVRQNCPNQTAYIIIDERTGERTVLWQRSDELRLQPNELKKEDIAQAGMLHIDGYDVDAAAFAAKTAREHGIPVSLDVDTVYPDFEEVLTHVDYLVAGSAWPKKWTGKSDPCEALKELQREFKNSVVAMTLGSKGSLALKDGRWYYSAAYEVTCVDTTGAGDVFHGAFCYAMSKGMPMGAALEFSNAAAALNCTAIGARGHVPHLAEVRALMSDPTVQRRADEALESLVPASLSTAAARVR